MMATESKSKDPYLSFFEAFADTDAALEDVSLGHEIIAHKTDVISTGSLILDDALGAGGLPMGRLIQYYGNPGAGKSMLAMIGMVEAQKKSLTARQMFIDAEGTFDRVWAKSLGMDLSRVVVISGEMAVIGQRCFEMLLGVPKKDAKTHAWIGQQKEGLLDKIASGELDYNFICLDSLASILVPMEDTSEVGKQNISLLARFLSPTLRKLSLAVRKANIPFVVINHVRSSMDSYGNGRTFTGGNAYQHFLSANIYFQVVNRADAKILDEKDQKIGHRLLAVVEKSKFGPPRRGEFDVQFDKGIINQEEEIATLAIDYGIVDHPTAPSYIYGERKWVGKEKFSAALIEDKALAAELIQKIGEARDKKHEAKLAEQEAVSEKLIEETEKKPKSKKKDK